MKLICVNEEYQHYFIADDEPQPKVNKKEIEKWTDLIYTLMGYRKHQIKLFKFVIYTYYTKLST